MGTPLAAHGATIGALIRRILPEGSNPRWGTSRRSWEDCPNWAPDLFAVVASLAELSGFYAEPPFASPWRSRRYFFNARYRDSAVELGRRWSQSGTAPGGVNAIWKRLRKHDRCIVSDRGPRSVFWKKAAMRLISIADEACAGIGFLPLENSPPRSPSVAVLRGHVQLLKEMVPSLIYLPFSLCKMVRPDVACVQPKTNTPRVGVTLRSLTHHVALLPPAGTVQTSWKFAHPDSSEPGPLNLLLVPFPYTIACEDFIAQNTEDRRRPKRERTVDYFGVTTSWIGDACGPAEITEFLVDLIRGAATAGQTHGIIMPEMALPKACADEVAVAIADEAPEVEFFVVGTSENERGGLRNCATTYRLHNGAILQQISQSKHHRWKLDRRQIETYGLGSRLHPDSEWWEQIEVAGRSCAFEVLRDGASFAVLVCEDLARFDPVFPALAAVGPNLVIALLMDGPQLKGRWSDRYATSLADDPGSSVLTLTSIGMIGRAFDGGSPRKIALWKDSSGAYREIELKKNRHAVAVSLLMNSVLQRTLDGRTDNFNTQAFHLGSIKQIGLTRKPAWLA